MAAAAPEARKINEEWTVHGDIRQAIKALETLEKQAGDLSENLRAAGVLHNGSLVGALSPIHYHNQGLKSFVEKLSFEFAFSSDSKYIWTSLKIRFKPEAFTNSEQAKKIKRILKEFGSTLTLTLGGLNEEAFPVFDFKGTWDRTARKKLALEQIQRELALPPEIIYDLQNPVFSGSLTKAEQEFYTLVDRLATLPRPTVESARESTNLGLLQTAQALEESNKARARSGDALLTLAEAYHKRGNFKNAYEIAASIVPNGENAFYYHAAQKIMGEILLAGCSHNENSQAPEIRSQRAQAIRHLIEANCSLDPDSPLTYAIEAQCGNTSPLRNIFRSSSKFDADALIALTNHSEAYCTIENGGELASRDAKIMADVDNKKLNDEMEAWKKHEDAVQEWAIEGNIEKIKEDIDKSRKYLSLLRVIKQQAVEEGRGEKLDLYAEERAFREKLAKDDANFAILNVARGDRRGKKISYINRDMKSPVDKVTLEHSLPTCDSSHADIGLELYISLRIFFRVQKEKSEMEAQTKTIKQFANAFHGIVEFRRKRCYSDGEDLTILCHYFHWERIKPILNQFALQFKVPLAIIANLQDPTFFGNQSEIERDLCTAFNQIAEGESEARKLSLDRALLKRAQEFDETVQPKILGDAVLTLAEAYYHRGALSLAYEVAKQAKNYHHYCHTQFMMGKILLAKAGLNQDPAAREEREQAIRHLAEVGGMLNSNSLLARALQIHSGNLISITDDILTGFDSWNPEVILKIADVFYELEKRKLEAEAKGKHAACAAAAALVAGPAIAAAPAAPVPSAFPAAMPVITHLYAAAQQQSNAARATATTAVMPTESRRDNNSPP